MPESKARRKARPPSRRRNKARETRARETQAAQRDAERKKISPQAYMKRRIFGWVLVVLGVVVFVTHLMEHMQIFEFASPGVEDLVAGYPLAALLGIAGAIVLSK